MTYKLQYLISDDRSMARIGLEAMLQVHCRNPKHAACEDVAEIIVNTFADVTEKGERLDCGYYSLLRSIKSTH